MIKVLLNGTPVYKLCFSRRKFKSLKKKNVTAGDIINKINACPHDPDKEAVARIIREAFESKPLYETTALVFMADAKHGEPPVATATTRQSKLDDNLRSTAREVALGRLLRTKDSPPFSEVERKAIRAAYDNRLKTSGPPKTPAGGASGTPLPLRAIKALASGVSHGLRLVA